MDQKDYRLAAVMFTDVVGFSRMMEEDEAGTLDLLQYHNSLITGLAEQYKGRVIKTIGDAFLLDFPNATNAVKCAVDIQEELYRHNQSGEHRNLVLRIGVHLGDIYFFEDDALGEGINIASRLQGLARPGRICVSQDVYNLVSSNINSEIIELGMVKLKNISREIIAYEIATSQAPLENAGKSSLEAEAGTATPATSGADGAEAEQAEPAAVPDRDSPTGQLSFEEVKTLVLQEIKKAGRRLSISEVRERVGLSSAQLDRALEQLADRGFLTRLERPQGGASFAPTSQKVARSYPERRGGGDGNDKESEILERQWDRALEGEAGAQDGPDTADPLVTDYIEQTESAFERSKQSFRGHLGAWAGVNAFLFLLWLFASGGGFPWFLIPALAWGIGLVSHWGLMHRKQLELDDLLAVENLNRERLRILRKLHKEREKFGSQLVSSGMTSIFLVALNLITSPGFFWAIFPVGGMGIGLFAAYPNYQSKTRQLLARLQQAGAVIRGKLSGLLRRRRRTGGSGVRFTPGESASSQAEKLKTAVESQMKGFERGSSPIDEDFQPVLDNYVEQIRLLDHKNDELAQILNSIPTDELEQDMARLKRRRTEADDRGMVEEYDKSISEIERQQRSYTELKNEKERLELRMQSALNSLKQMQLDLARMKSLSGQAEHGSVHMLEDKSRELSEYLEDLRKGYDELE